MSWLSSLTCLDYFIIGTALLLLAYIGLTWNHDYFARRNIPFRKPIPLFGNQFRNALRLQSMADFMKYSYDGFPGCKVFGVFQFLKPTLFIRDPELLKSITVKDFNHFTDHFGFLPDGAEPFFSKSLFMLKGQKWKNVRNLLSPAFTSSKMKGMFHLMTECGQQLVDYLQTKIKESAVHNYFISTIYAPLFPQLTNTFKKLQDWKFEEYFPYIKSQTLLEMDMKDLFTRYANDVIATSAFGISCDSLKNPENEFYMCGKEIANLEGLKSLIFVGYMIFPKLMKLLNIPLFSKSSEDFLLKTVKETIEAREKNGIIRPDMIHLLMQARKGELKDDGEPTGVENTDDPKPTNMKYDLSDEEITAQAMAFFLAGFEPVSVLLGFVSILLAMHQDVQERLQAEIDETLKECGGKVTYDALHRMKYLDMVISETLRMYSPAAGFDRQCVKTYRIPASENTPEIYIKPKDVIFVPTHGFHHDPQYFPNPETFDPERFSEENKVNIKPFTYMPFGFGPRSCIGNRFALMENKIALVYLLSSFSLHLTDKSSVPIRLSASTMQMKPDKGYWLGVKKRSLQ